MGGHCTIILFLSEKFYNTNFIVLAEGKESKIAGHGLNIRLSRVFVCLFVLMREACTYLNPDQKI